MTKNMFFFPFHFSKCSKLGGLYFTWLDSFIQFTSVQQDGKRKREKVNKGKGYTIFFSFSTVPLLFYHSPLCQCLSSVQKEHAVIFAF